jgi:uncharacterized protein involved in exopolysaccharide biosynthesis
MNHETSYKRNAKRFDKKITLRKFWNWWKRNSRWNWIFILLFIAIILSPFTTR